MTEESGNGSSVSDGGAPPAAAAAPAAGEQQHVEQQEQQQPEKKKSPTPLADAHDAGVVERANAAKKAEEDARQAAFEKEKDAELAEQRREQEQEREAASVPLVIPEHVKHRDTDIEVLAEAAPLIAEAGYSGAHAQRLVDLLGEEAIAHVDAPRWEDPDAVLGYLRHTWGSEFETRLKMAQATMKKLPAKMQAFLEETGLGNAPSVLNTLANLGEGLMGLSKAQAFHKLEEMRKSGPYRDASHRDHKLYVARARVLTQAASFGDDPGAKERAIKSAFSSAVGAAARGEQFAETKLAAQTGELARVAEIRKDPKYRRGDKALVKEMNQLMERLHPGEE